MGKGDAEREGRGGQASRGPTEGRGGAESRGQGSGRGRDVVGPLPPSWAAPCTPLAPLRPPALGALLLDPPQVPIAASPAWADGSALWVSPPQGRA